MQKALSTAIIGLTLGLSHPAVGADLGGRWNVTSRHVQDYEGVVIIDREGRVRWDAPADGGRPAEFVGFIKHNDASRAEMTLTDRVKVVQVKCVTAERTALDCYAVYANGTASKMFSLTRIGDAPANLIAPR